MPVWLATILWKCVIPLVIAALRKSGYVNIAEGLALKAGAKVVAAVEGIKTYPEYPNTPPHPISKGPPNGNYNRQNIPDDYHRISPSKGDL